MIPKMCEKGATHLSKCLTLEKFNLSEHFSQFDLATVTQFQSHTNIFGENINQQSSGWLFDFIYNSTTTELCDSVKLQYEILKVSQQGGIVYIWLLLSEMFKMMRDVVTSLKEFLKQFTQEGVLKISDENVSVVIKKLRVKWDKCPARWNSNWDSDWIHHMIGRWLQWCFSASVEFWKSKFHSSDSWIGCLGSG